MTAGVHRVKHGQTGSGPCPKAEGPAVSSRAFAEI